MKNRLSFLLITSRTGIQRHFSIDKRLLYLAIFFSLLLVGAGITGALRSAENLEMKQKQQLLAAEIQHMQTIAKTVAIIEQDERAIRDHLGLNNTEQPPGSEHR